MLVCSRRTRGPLGSSRRAPQRRGPRKGPGRAGPRCPRRSRSAPSGAPSRAGRRGTRIGPWIRAPRRPARRRPQPRGPRGSCPGPPPRPAAGSPMDRGPRRAEASSLPPVPEDRGDPAEGLQEERALFRFPGDELHAGSFLLRGRRELLDDVRLLEDGQGAAVRRADPEIPLVDDRLLPLPVPVRAADPEARLPQALRDEEDLHGADLEGPANLGLPVRGEPARLLPDLVHEALDLGLLPHEVEVREEVPRLLDELPEPVLVRVPRVEERRQDLLLQLVVEVVLVHEVLLRVAGSADEDPADLGAGLKRLRHQVADFLVPLVGRDLDEPLEPPRALPAPPALPAREALGAF